MWLEFVCSTNQRPKSTIKKKAHKPLRASFIASINVSAMFDNHTILLFWLYLIFSLVLSDLIVVPTVFCFRSTRMAKVCAAAYLAAHSTTPRTTRTAWRWTSLAQTPTLTSPSLARLQQARHQPQRTRQAEWPGLPSRPRPSWLCCYCCLSCDWSRKPSRGKLGSWTQISGVTSEEGDRVPKCDVIILQTLPFKP